MAIYLRDFETHDEFISAYTGGEYVEPWVSYVEETKEVAFNKTQLVKIEIVGLSMENDVPATGKTVNKDDCEYTVLAFYDDYTEKDITDEATVTGSLVVEENELTERHSAGTLTLTAEYSGFSDSDSITVWQEAAAVPSYLTFNITSGGNISWGCQGESGVTVEYKKNNGEWTEITATPLDPDTMSGGTKINVVAGDKVQFRGDNPTYADPNECLPYGTFELSTAGFTLEGNIMSLIDSVDYEEITGMTNDNVGAFALLFGMCTGLTSAENLVLPATTLADFCYQYMFADCTSLTKAPELPATTLANYCYSYMFADCTSLTKAPELPATTLAEGCYGSIFQGCTSLTTAPALPAETMVDSCYYEMFRDCTSLTTAPELPATTMAANSYMTMFSGCRSLVNAPALPATTLANYCYSNMFRNCTNLAATPALPATTLAEGCYSNMFSGCTNLTTVPSILPATILATSCYYGMFQNCTSLTTAPALPATTLTNGCYYSMFKGCTSLATAPELPANTLAQTCYYRMFLGCASLNYIKCLATNISADFCTKYWLDNVSSAGTFVKDPNMSSWTTGNNGIPNGWTVQDDPNIPAVA